MSECFNATGPLRGEIIVPGDKSVSHRAVIFGALAEGHTIIEGFLDGDDCLSTVSCLRQMGVNIKQEGQKVEVEGVGLNGLREADDILDAGNSGTTARLLLGVLAGQPFYTVLSGDHSLRRRPMKRVTSPLMEMGARIYGRSGGAFLPLSVDGGNLTPVTYNSPVASAQVKSALLLAGLFASGETIVTEPHKSRDHTERMLAAFGAEVHVDGNKVRIKGRPALSGQNMRVPGDISSAAFFLVAASIVPGSDITLRNVGLNPTRTGVIDVLTRMGANLEFLDIHEESGEPVADIRVRAASLHGVEIGGEIIPRLIDELPVLAVAALYATGKTVVRDAAELRVKESDRIAVITQELTALGADIRALEDGFIVQGGYQLKGGDVESNGDHRIAMSLCVASLGAKGTVNIKGLECIAISYPGFLRAIKGLSL